MGAIELFGTFSDSHRPWTVSPTVTIDDDTVVG